jgi:murein DD-endopeptidase MepM/ murein hydrolase activator NlpD
MKLLRNALLSTAFFACGTNAGFNYPYSNNSNVILNNAARDSVEGQATSIVRASEDGGSYQNYTFHTPALGDRDFSHIHSSGENTWRHMGVDIWESYDSRVVSNTTDVKAVGDGLVIAKSYGVSPFGRALIVVHPQAGKNNSDIYSLYLHMANSTNFKSIQVGQYVNHNQVIGDISRTGAAGTISHLHLELRFS